MFFYLGGIKITCRTEVPLRRNQTEKVGEGDVDRGWEIKEKWESGGEWEQHHWKSVHTDRTTEDKEKPVYNKNPLGFSA